MADIRIAGIMRAGAFSPNHIGNDAAIFNSVADQLRKRGCIVNVYNEEQFVAGAVDSNIILNMCREPRSIALLQACEDRGELVINSGYGIENCTRERMARILLGSGIGYPATLIVNTDEGVRDTLRNARIDRCWIKRADTHSMHKEDVTFVRHAEEAQEVLQEYFLRGIKRAVINNHVTGDHIKFYGVTDTPFFFWFYPLDARSVRPGDAAPVHTSFDTAALKAMCTRAADVLDVKIYGGDCIVEPDGKITIIDFKDWPSFAPCRNEASTYIAKAVINSVVKYQSK